MNYNIQKASSKTRARSIELASKLIDIDLDSDDYKTIFRPHKHGRKFHPLDEKLTKNAINKIIYGSIINQLNNWMLAGGGDEIDVRYEAINLSIKQNSISSLEFSDILEKSCIEELDKVMKKYTAIKYEVLEKYGDFGFETYKKDINNSEKIIINNYDDLLGRISKLKSDIVPELNEKIFKAKRNSLEALQLEEDDRRYSNELKKLYNIVAQIDREVDNTIAHYYLDYRNLCGYGTKLGIEHVQNGARDIHKREDFILNVNNVFCFVRDKVMLKVENILQNAQIFVDASKNLDYDYIDVVTGDKKTQLNLDNEQKDNNKLYEEILTYSKKGKINTQISGISEESEENTDSVANTKISNIKIKR